MSETQLYQLECQLVALFAGVLFLAWILKRLRRSEPGIAIGGAVATAYAIRVMSVIGLNQLDAARTLRGGDELLFVSNAQALSFDSLASKSGLDTLTHHFHVFFMSINFRLLSQVPQLMLRFEVAAIAVAGLALLAAAAYVLAGRRAAAITAWVLAFEPANVFFSGILHKEPFMMFAEGLVAYGGARLWKRGDYRALIPMLIGCLIATATRPYVGWFLAAASAFLALHAGARRNSASSSVVLSAVIVALMIAFFPTVWNASSTHKLKDLQQSQDANAADTTANLSLERVDYSTRGKIIVNLPKRIADIATKPYPWQVQNLSQQMGALGTIFLFGVLFSFIWTLFKGPGKLLRRAGPLLYPLFFLLVAYALSAGNAGTAYRYRTHLVALLVAILFVLRAQPEESEAAVETAPAYLHVNPPLGRDSVPTLAK